MTPPPPPDTDISRGSVVDVLVGLLAEIGEVEDSRAFFDSICEALCRLTSLERAGLLLYDPGRYLARAVGSHGIERSLIGQVEATLDEAPMVQRALAEDRVVTVSTLEGEVPDRYAHFAGITTLVCGPVAAGGYWFGVIFADKGGGRFELEPGEEQTMLTLGRLAAVAATVEGSTRQQERARYLDERIGLIREVHEQVIQRLFGLSLVLGAEQPLSDQERSRCADEVQSVLVQLRLTLGRPLSPPRAPTETTLAELLAHRQRVSDLQLDWAEGVEVPSHLEALAQSVVIEALRNADRHARPRSTRVRVRGSDSAFELEVANDGVGVGPGRSGSGLGLRILTLEALQHDGLVEFGPSGDDGWRVKLLVPIDDE